RNPPPGPLLAQRMNRKPAIHRTHATNRGDTLAMIARQYQVSVNGLRSANSLSNDVIRIGQVLQIP
ncbi:MAG: LysM peptidoglycan-binding domain-containing protein, partial [Planctomycetes bacterium]|nr:LysM peptidoglycan-binding domain-containing protein [Planctomycetota bacterium]